MKSSYLNLGKYYGILSGVASSLSYAVAGLLWAIAAEKYNRKYLITMSCIIYSSCSFFSGQINSLFVFALMRFFKGAAISASSPVIYSMVNDYFPKEKITTANSLL
jgi:MFS family permease